jgi:transposase-like protein
MRQNDVPETVTIDKSGSNKAAIEVINDDTGISIMVRQVKYLNRQLYRAGSSRSEVHHQTDARL